MEAFQKGNYRLAVERFRLGKTLSHAQGEARRELRFSNALGAGLFAALSYREAARELQDAYKLAVELGDAATAAVISLNLSSLLTQSGDLDGAGRHLQESLRLLPPNSQHRAAALYQQAFLTLQQGDIRISSALLEAALALAGESGDRNLESRLLDMLGNLRLTQGRTAESEALFLEAFRLQRLYRLGPASDPLRSLGRWHFARAEWPQAERLFTLAIADWKDKPTPMPLWLLVFDRGAARARQGDWAGAFADYRGALANAGLWRSGSLSPAGARAAFDVSLADLTAALAEAGQQVAEADGSAWAREAALLGLESGRAHSLRAAHLEARARTSTLPAGYVEALSSFRNALLAGWRKDGSAESPELRAARFRLNQEEIAFLRPDRSATPSPALPGGLAGVRRRLGPGRVFISFLIGDSESLRWVLTADTLVSSRLPGARIIQSWAHKTRLAVASSSALPAEASRLAGALFGNLPRGAWEASQWVLSLDGPLFQVPLAALPLPAEPGRRLIERVSLEVVPSLDFIDGQDIPAPGPWIIAGDAIYNRADPRLPQTPQPAPGRFWTLSAAPADNAAGWQLPRLAGSGLECSRLGAQWSAAGRPVRVLTGREVSSEALRRNLAARPAVIHLAAHLAAPSRAAAAPVQLHSPLTGSSPFRASVPPDAVLLLGLDARGVPDLMGSTEIATLSVPGSLVVLSGCESGQGPFLSGAGLWALARAWVAAGASSVVASLWPIPDHAGEFFEEFYRAYSRLPRSVRGRSALALQQAQTVWLRHPNGGRQSSLWASFFVLGKE